MSLSTLILSTETATRINSFTLKGASVLSPFQFCRTSFQTTWNTTSIFTQPYAAICGEWTWCLPAHLRQDSAFEKSDHYLEAHQQIDLFAAETAFSLAEILTMFEDSLPALIKQRINYETRRRVLEPFQKVEQPWEQSTHNWSAVCAGSIGACAMYLVDSEEERQLILDKCVKSVSYFVLGLTNEGVCQEGYHYWQYGFGYFIYFADLLKSIQKARSIYSRFLR